jgi:hypothetical protein
MFYHFDWTNETNGPVRWGFVDNFQAGISALAMAATLRSIQTVSTLWLITGSILAAFTLLIKPSGLMIMAIVGLIWLILVASKWLGTTRLEKTDQTWQKYLLNSLASFLLIYGLVFYICINSEYFSEELFAYAKQALIIMNEVLKADIKTYLLLFHKSTGEVIIIWIMTITVLFIYQKKTSKIPSKVNQQAVPLTSLVSSGVIWFLGAWYWLIVQAGGNQIRYFYPPLLMGCICVIPAAIVIWPTLNRRIQLLLFAMCLVPPINIFAILLAGNNPSIDWQKLTGVSISIGTYGDATDQAYRFLNVVRKSGKNATVYSVSYELPSIIFENIGKYEEIIKPNQPRYNVIMPMDWINGFVIRIKEILGSDYILVKNFDPNEANAILNKQGFDTFLSERTAFEAWLSTLNADNDAGINIVSESPSLRLLHIKNANALYLSIDDFVRKYSWRDAFVSTNKPLWWNAETFKDYNKERSVEEINFGNIYKIHAVTINTENNDLKVEVWWEELLHEESNKYRYLFFHLVNSSDKFICPDKQIALSPYDPPDDKKNWHHDELIFNCNPINGKSAFLGFGIYQTDGNYLLPDKGQTDWNGKRVIIPLSPETPNAH